MKRAGTKHARTVGSIAIALACACVIVLSGCVSVYNENEEMTNPRNLGEPVDVTVQFNFLMFFNRGPYEATVRPVGVVSSDTGDYFQVEYTITQSPDGEPADYATVTTSLNLLTNENGEVEFGIWCTDTKGTQMDPRNSWLDVGTTYTFYIPLKDVLGRSTLQFLKYVTISDREGFYARTGETYWYTVQ